MTRLPHALCCVSLPEKETIPDLRAAVLARKCVLDHKLICLLQGLLERLGAGSKRGALGQELD